MEKVEYGGFEWQLEQVAMEVVFDVLRLNELPLSVTRVKPCLIDSFSQGLVKQN